jgi:hypothetical protein
LIIIEIDNEKSNEAESTGPEVEETPAANEEVVGEPENDQAELKDPEVEKPKGKKKSRKDKAVEEARARAIKFFEEKGPLK